MASNSLESQREWRNWRRSCVFVAIFHSLAIFSCLPSSLSSVLIRPIAPSPLTAMPQCCMCLLICRQYRGLRQECEDRRRLTDQTENGLEVAILAYFFSWRRCLKLWSHSSGLLQQEVRQRTKRNQSGPWQSASVAAASTSDMLWLLL